MPESSLVVHFGMLARYNTIVNVRLFEVCRQLSDAEYHQERSGSFRSIHRTLNHILLGDRIWMERLTSADITDTPALDRVLYEDFQNLRAAREAEDARIEAFMIALTDDFLRRDFEYLNNAGVRCIDPAPIVLAHFFNHQTHHRGQVHVMLSQTGIRPPNLDLHRAVRPVGEA